MGEFVKYALLCEIPGKLVDCLALMTADTAVDVGTYVTDDESRLTVYKVKYCIACDEQMLAYLAEEHWFGSVDNIPELYATIEVNKV